MSSDNGQMCTSCMGARQKLKQYAAIDSNGKIFTDYRLENCESCHGTGWLNGRSQ